MKIKTVRYLLALCLFVMITPAHAYQVVIGKITKVRAFSQPLAPYSETNPAALYLYMDELPAPCGSGPGRVAITTSHPLYPTVLSIALSAKMSQTRVELWYDEQCTIRNSAWDFSLIQVEESPSE